ncbi:hypothetical protein K435DRAFT_869679 [Dendrothele bispora CBS 962.96]|uniref:Barwin-like endoglucanase n=1 Tax=Dendrothele bispora (strain CBS 962.96) TaxID=1314807 RepID=A0A4S8L8G6_DENBC|nr:hypothetical protein K435DRAFT_869679 [Dendrothele bispora CBS 962.96]
MAVMAASGVSAVPVPQPAAVENGVLEARDLFSGKATYFYVGLGNCGWQSVDTDWVVALATSTYANGEHCGKQVKITNSDGTEASATVVDSCPSCADGDLDMSPGLFSNFASLDLGVFDITWEFE